MNHFSKRGPFAQTGLSVWLVLWPQASAVLLTLSAFLTRTPQASGPTFGSAQSLGRHGTSTLPLAPALDGANTCGTQAAAQSRFWPGVPVRLLFEKVLPTRRQAPR